MSHRHKRLLAGLGALLGLALALGAWRYWREAQGPASPDRVPPPSAAPPAAASGTRYPAPQRDFPASRLHERVDGAESLLRAAGCRRLLYWRIAQPPADLELLVFDAAQGAAKWLERDAGQDRSAGVPGDEGWMSSQCLYFRKGTLYVRLIADQPTPTQALLSEGKKLEQALARGEVRP